MELKRYQQNTLDRIGEFLKTLKKEKPEFAYMHLARQPYKDVFFGEEIPFICIKIPTGGGKTLVGCHATTQIMDAFLKEKMGRGIVMWFVPSEAIKSQTLRKFKDRRDIHRKVLDEYLDNNIKIFSNEEALKIRKEDIENNLCVIISSLDAFRKEKSLQKKYKVYKENGFLMNHFENSKESTVLEKDKSGIINSLANVIRINNPLIVIDEGHKTKTRLSIEFLKDLNPSFVIEYTATPRAESNILVDIHSSELKEAQMVKLPLVLESHTQWQVAMLEGVKARAKLERITKKEKESIRPIALIQAEQEKEAKNKITVSKLKEFLIKDMKIHENEIAIKTSRTKQLDGINLFAKNCKIRFIITVNALAEGWDCSFAYLLISVANIGSKIAVEQIIGRIMRMPYAKKRANDNLNKSYIFASARNFNEAVTQIIEGLKNNGYSKYDVIDVRKKKKEYEFDIERSINEDFAVPLLAFKSDRLTFEDLVGESFRLHKQKIKFNFIVHYDADGKAIIDIREDDNWFRGPQQMLKLTQRVKDCSQRELIQWLDKRLRFTMLDKDDKMKFLKKVIDSIKGYTIGDLSINRYVLLEQLKDVIETILKSYAKKRFEKFLKEGKLKVRKFENFPETITLTQEIPQEFNKNYYSRIDKLNKEEQQFVDRLDLDALRNIKFWIRNREKKDPFYLQGWQRNKFYPDFIALTTKKNILVLEWKGEDRISNADTKYKERIARVWQQLGKRKLHFFLIHKKNVEEALSKIKQL